MDFLAKRGSLHTFCKLKASKRMERLEDIRVVASEDMPGLEAETSCADELMEILKNGKFAVPVAPCW